jgi:alpha-ketoglutarate-dependent taurine dioxygenase
MTGTEKLLRAIDAGESRVWACGEFDIDEMVRLLGSRLVQTSGRDYAVAMHRDDPTDCSDRTEYFDWHSDGLYHARPPRYVLLHCLDPGDGKVNTEFAEMDYVLWMLRPSSYRTLLKLRSHYVGHGGTFDHPVIAIGGALLASRGYVSPLPGLSLEEIPSVRDIGVALSDLYDHLEGCAMPHEWRAGGTLIFDQYRYLHRRKSAVIDRERKLLRLWFN